MKKQIKRLLCSGLILMFLLSAMVPALALQPESFSDVPQGYWAYQSIMNMVRLGVIEGYPDGTFKPEKQVARDEFAKILCGATNNPLITPNSNYFEDVPKDNWAFSYVETVKEFLTGYPSSGGGKPLFKGRQDATREDVAVALVKIKGFDKTAKPNPNILDDMFKDVNSVSTNLKNLIAIAVEKKLLTGYPDSTIRCSQTLTRAEAATLIDRANSIAGDVKVASPQPTDNTKKDDKKETKDNKDNKTAPKILYVSVDCTRAVGKVGEKLQASAKSYYTNGQSKNVTNDANWRSTNDSVISVNGNGEISLLKEGTAKVRVTYDGKTDEQVIIVLAKETTNTEIIKLIKAVPGEKQIKVNESFNLKAEAIYDSGKIIDITNTSKWSSANGDIAVVSSSGKVVAKKEGVALIKVEYKDYICYSVITVVKQAEEPPEQKVVTMQSISFPYSIKELKVGEKITLQAIANYSDDSKKDISSEVKWTSSSADIGTVSDKGEFTAKAEGTVKITIEKDGKSSYMYIIVTKE